MIDERRIEELEREMKSLQREAAVVPVLAEQIAGLRADIAQVREAQRDTLRWLIGFCGSVALACIVALIGVLQMGLPG